MGLCIGTIDFEIGDGDGWVARVAGFNVSLGLWCANTFNGLIRRSSLNEGFLKSKEVYFFDISCIITFCLLLITIIHS